MDGLRKVPPPSYLDETEQQVWEMLTSIYFNYGLPFSSFARVLGYWQLATEFPDWPAKDFYIKNAAHKSTKP